MIGPTNSGKKTLIRRLKNIDNKYGNVDMLCEGDRKITKEFPPNDFKLPTEIRNVLKMSAIFLNTVFFLRKKTN